MTYLGIFLIKLLWLKVHSIFLVGPFLFKAGLGLDNSSSNSSFIGILLPNFFWPVVRKNCSSDREKLLKFQAEGQEFAKNFRLVEQFIQTVKGQNNFW